MTIQDDFKNALSSWASGVSVVSTRADGLAYGLTVSSFSSLSLDPPLVLVCLSNRNRLPDMIAAANGFTVSVLASDQADVSNSFAKSGREPTTEFEGAEEQQTESGLPAVAGAAAFVSCELHDTLIKGDHTIVIGRVVQAESRDCEPLLYHNRRYRMLHDDPPAQKTA